MQRSVPGVSESERKGNAPPIDISIWWGGRAVDADLENFVGNSLHREFKSPPPFVFLTRRIKRRNIGKGEGMGEGFTIFEIVQIILYALSPILFLIGIVMVLFGNYKILEDNLNKEIGGIKKKIFPKLEDNIFSFHSWLLEKRIAIGLICVIFAMALFLGFKR